MTDVASIVTPRISLLVQATCTREMNPTHMHVKKYVLFHKVYQMDHYSNLVLQTPTRSLRVGARRPIHSTYWLVIFFC